MLVNSQRRFARGFTIIELMIVVTIIAILASLAAPSFTGFLATMRIKTMAGEIQSALTYARSEAMKRNTDVTVTPAAAGWQGGWTISASGVTPLQQREAMVAGTAHITSSSTASVLFHANGRSATPDVFVNLSSTDTSTTRCIKISLSGPPIVREICP